MTRPGGYVVGRAEPSSLGRRGTWGSSRTAPKEPGGAVRPELDGRTPRGIGSARSSLRPATPAIGRSQTPGDRARPLTSPAPRGGRLAASTEAGRPPAVDSDDDGLPGCGTDNPGRRLWGIAARRSAPITRRRDPAVRHRRHTRTSRARPRSASGSTPIAARGPDPLLRRDARGLRVARRDHREDHRRRDRGGLRPARRRARTTRCGRSRRPPRAYACWRSSTTELDARGAFGSSSGRASRPATSSSARRAPASTS